MATGRPPNAGAVARSRPAASLASIQQLGFDLSRTTTAGESLLLVGPSKPMKAAISGLTHDVPPVLNLETRGLGAAEPL